MKRGLMLIIIVGVAGIAIGLLLPKLGIMTALKPPESHSAPLKLRLEEVIATTYEESIYGKSLATYVPPDLLANVTKFIGYLDDDPTKPLGENHNIVLFKYPLSAVEEGRSLVIEVKIIKAYVEDPEIGLIFDHAYYGFNATTYSHYETPALIHLLVWLAIEDNTTKEYSLKVLAYPVLAKPQEGLVLKLSPRLPGDIKDVKVAGIFVWGCRAEILNVRYE